MSSGQEEKEKHNRDYEIERAQRIFDYLLNRCMRGFNRDIVVFINNAHKSILKPKTVIELVGLCLLGLYTCETRRTNNLTQGLLIETQRATKLAESQQTPWVGIEENTVRTKGPTFYFGNVPNMFPTVMLELSMSLKNFGNAPALHQTTQVSVFEDTGASIPPTDQMEVICKFAEMGATTSGAANPGQGQMILPNAPIPTAISTNIQMDLTKSTHVRRLWVFLCFAYQDPRGKVVHHSRYWYHTVQGENPDVPVSGHPNWTFIPIKSLILWGATAD